MYSEIVAAVQSVKTLGELVKAANGLSNYTEFVSAVSEVSAKLMDATAVALASQEKQSALANRIVELENQLREIENWEGQIRRYRLHQFATGTLGYALQQEMQNGEPLHYLCATCVDKKQISKLQVQRSSFLMCHSCKAEIRFKIPQDTISTTGRYIAGY